MTSHNHLRIGVVAIIIYDPNNAYKAINDILHNYSSLIIGRLGLPYRERNLAIISIIVEGTTDEIGALTGKIGQISGTTVKTAFAKDLPPQN